MKGGFRKDSEVFKKQIKNIVSKEAQGFLLASFLGGFIGGGIGVTVILAIIGWLNFITA